MHETATLTIALVALFSVTLHIQFLQIVKASPNTIYIRSDGSLSPPTAAIQRDGDIYTLTENIHDSIVIQRSNIIIDGGGQELQGYGSGHGFNLCMHA